MKIVPQDTATTIIATMVIKAIHVLENMCVKVRCSASSINVIKQALEIPAIMMINANTDTIVYNTRAGTVTQAILVPVIANALQVIRKDFASIMNVHFIR